MHKLTALAVIRPTSCCIPLFRQFASRSTPFSFCYILSSSSIIIAVVSLPGAKYVEYNCAATSFRSQQYWLSYVLQRVAFHFFAKSPPGQLRFPSTTPLVLSQYLSRSCRCLVPCMSKTDLQKLHAEVNCIGYDKSYNMLRYTFSSICFKDNSVSVLLHSHFFLNVYHGRVAACCQVCRRPRCKNFMQKFTVLAVIRPETRCVPARFRQSASRTTPL